jgi:phosphate transport system permease protein
VLALASLMGIPVGIGRVFIWRSLAAARCWQRDPVYRRCAEWRAVDRDGHCDVLADCDAAEAFLGFAGGVALAIMMVPTITRTTEEMLATVPHAIREAALGWACRSGGRCFR